MFSYEQSLKDSINYFNGDELAASVFLSKYALKDNDGNILENTPDMMHKRIAKEFARIEKNKFKEPYSEEFIYNLLKDFKYIVPQGSPMYGIGNTYQTVSLSNCYVVESPLDSYGSICRTDEHLAQISKRRGGVGTDLSNLRPEGACTKNAAKSSTGIISFMERYSNTIREVGQSGRRGALMLTLDVLHPQSPDFAVVKNDNTKVTGANISLRLRDEFMQAVIDKKDITLRWPIDGDSKITKIVNAEELWKTIIHSAWLRAEPGLLFWDNFIKNSPADCYENFKSTSTNPCAEILLSPYDSCRLLLLNLFSFVENPFEKNAYFDFKKFEEYSKISQRLMDDLIDLELECIDKIISKVKSDPEPINIKNRELELWENIKKACINGRRTGTGVTAVGDTIAALNLSYGSDDSIEVVEKIYKTLKLSCYRSSVDMSKELGSFSCYDSTKELNCEFIKRIKEEDINLYNDMVKYGRRNIALLTTAPAGSVSCLTQTTSGIEPVFDITPYKRRKKINPNDKNTKVDFVDQNGDSWQEYDVLHPKLKMWMEKTKNKDYKQSPWYKCGANDINWIQRIKLQSVAQNHIDHSISSTVNLPNDVTEEVVSEIYMKAWELNCKGITVYRDGCRSGVLIRDEIKDQNKIQKTNSPKRPKKLKSELHHVNLKNTRYYVAVGLLGDDVYEIFTGMNHNHEGEIIIPKTVKDGYIIKNGRSKYIFSSSDGEYHLTNGHNDDTADALTRLISTAFRHGADVSFVVHQLEKTKGDMMSFAKVLARVLKKYIPDGTLVYGETCPNCSSKNIVRTEGCLSCRDCGYSKC